MKRLLFHSDFLYPRPAGTLSVGIFWQVVLSYPLSVSSSLRWHFQQKKYVSTPLSALTLFPASWLHHALPLHPCNTLSVRDHAVYFGSSRVNIEALLTKRQLMQITGRGLSIKVTNVMKKTTSAANQRPIMLSIRKRAHAGYRYGDRVRFFLAPQSSKEFPESGRF